MVWRHAHQHCKSHLIFPLSTACFGLAIDLFLPGEGGTEVKVPHQSISEDGGINLAQPERRLAPGR